MQSIRRNIGLHLRVDTERINDLLAALTGSPLTATQRRQLRWLRIRATLSSTGWLSGLLTFLLLIVTVLALIVVGVFRVPVPSDVLSIVARLAANAIILGFSLWLYLYVSVAALDPKASFARAAYGAVRHIPDDETGWAASNGLALANASGDVARTLFRAITGRRINVTIRPDVADQALSLSERVLLTVPSTGSQFWRERTEQAHTYVYLLHDLTGLIAIGRLDLLDQAIQISEDLLADTVVTHCNADMAIYIHPLARRTALDAVAQYLLPISAFAVSVVALAISVVMR
jgi:hypothetical protein